MLPDQDLPSPPTPSQLETETRHDLNRTYQVLFQLLCQHKISFSDLKLLDQCATRTGIFDESVFSEGQYPPDEVAEADRIYQEGKRQITQIADQLPEDLQPFAEADWAIMMLGNEVAFREGVIRYWASQIEPQPGTNEEQILAVLGAISFMETNAPQFHNSPEPKYLYAGSLSIWMLKTTTPNNWLHRQENTTEPVNLSPEQLQPLQSWHRQIHDIDSCVNMEHHINFQSLFSLDSIPFFSGIFDSTDTDPRSPSLHAELRPTASDTNDYLDINLGGYHIAVATPEYSLAFKRLQLLQDPSKNNATEDMAVLIPLATDISKVDQIYAENLPLVVIDDN